MRKSIRAINSFHIIILFYGTLALIINKRNQRIKMRNKAKKMKTNTVFIMFLILIILVLEAVGGAIVYSAHVKEISCCAKTEGVLLE